MRIIGINIGAKASFKSLRTDKNRVGILKNGTKPINGNQRINIMKSLQNLAVNPNRENIEFLLDVAGGLKYGQNGSSEFRHVMDRTSLTDLPRENTDWNKVLKDTINAALNGAQEDVSDLKQKYEEIFDKKPGKELTSEQKEVLSLRKELIAKLTDENYVQDEDDIALITDIRTKTDYLTSSSEIPLKQKIECIKKFIYFLSDQYKIHPHLADKKLQAMDEMLDDMLIKIPGQDKQTNKKIDQRQSGICAAISICRKALAYEDKVQYMNVVMEELKDSPYMEVYDITEIGTGKKINIEKADINYNAALSRGYRILDASAHTWMQNAITSGDGSILTGKYTAFDDKYGVFDDSIWYEGLTSEYTPVKRLLKAIIKEEEQIRNFEKREKRKSEIRASVNQSRDKVITNIVKIRGLMKKSIREMFPDADEREIVQIQNGLIKFFTGSNNENEVNISDKLPKDAKQKVIRDYLSSLQTEKDGERTDITEEKLNKLEGLITDYINLDRANNRINTLTTPRTKYQYYKDLYKVAAAHRMAVEADVNISNDILLYYSKIYNIPPKDIAVVKYLTKQSDSLKTTDAKNKIAKDIDFIENKMPNEIEMVAMDLYGQGIRGLLSEFIGNIKEAIKDGTLEISDQLAASWNVSNDNDSLMNKAEQLEDLIKSADDDTAVDIVLRELGFNNRLHFIKTKINILFSQLEQGILPANLSKKKMREIENQIKMAVARVQETDKQYNSIMQEYNVPTEQEFVLEYLEKDGKVLSREKLNLLKRKFDYISSETDKNQTRIKDKKARQKANSKLYRFNEEEKAVFKQISEQMRGMKAFSKKTYKRLNSELKEELDAQYAIKGRLGGQFWVWEEGSTGLTPNEQIRIFEQMTGKPYYIENDIDKAVSKIKEGEGSGILASSMDDKDYAFHAQYIPAITLETFKDVKTGETKEEEVLWTDNSWGESEKDSYWDGFNGHEYTDYGAGYGWKDGFIVDKSYRIGQKVGSIKNATGVAKEDGEEFPLFRDVILPGKSYKEEVELYKLIEDICNIGKASEEIDTLEELLKSGENLRPEYLENLDKLVSARTDELEKRLKSEVKTREDYDKLPDNDIIKFTMEKIALYLATESPLLRDYVLEKTSLDELKACKDVYIAAYKESFLDLLGKNQKTLDNMEVYLTPIIIEVLKEIESKYGEKYSEETLDKITEEMFNSKGFGDALEFTPDKVQNTLKNAVTNAAVKFFNKRESAEYFIKSMHKNVEEVTDKQYRISDFDSFTITKSSVKESFIKSIDKYFNPKTDEELLEILKSMQYLDSSAINKYLDMLTPEDLGINFKTGSEIFERYQAQDTEAQNAFYKAAGLEEIYGNLSSQAEQVYRSIYVILSDLNVQKYINKFKGEMFDKYKVRQAFPQPVVFKDETLNKLGYDILEVIKQKVETINFCNNFLNISALNNKITDEIKNSELSRLMAEKQEININDNAELIDELNEQFTQLSELAEFNEDLYNVKAAADDILELLRGEDNIQGADFAEKIKALQNAFDALPSICYSYDSVIKQKSDEIKSIKANADIYIKTSIEPKYRDNGYTLINQIIDLMRKNAPEEYILETEYMFLRLASERHITKNPTELLKECVNAYKSGNANTVEYETKRRYLESALNTALLTRVQYKLVECQHNGYSSKLKSILPGIKLGNNFEIDITNNEGLLAIINQFTFADDDYDTLNLFLDQTGLGKSAVNALMEDDMPDRIERQAKSKCDAILKDIKGFDKLRKMHAAFFRRKDLEFDTPDDGFKAFAEYLESFNSSSEIIKDYIQAVKTSQVVDISMIKHKEEITDLLENYTEYMIENLQTEINNSIADLSNLSKMTAERLNLIAAIKLQENSEEYKKREEYLNIKRAHISKYEASITNRLKRAVDKINE